MTITVTTKTVENEICLCCGEKECIGQSEADALVMEKESKSRARLERLGYYIYKD